MNIFSKNDKGFTLIELLVVVSIIGILATLVVANLNAARSRARDAVRKADLRNIQTGLRLYYNDNSSFPSSLTFGSTLTGTNGTVYMNLVPNDPISPSQSYLYTYDSTNDAYTLTACLENTSDTSCSTTTVNGYTCTGCIYQLKP